MMNIRKLREQLRMGRSIYDLPLRVTFYARVSTDKIEQQGSLENQIQYYTDFIQRNPNWTYVEGYVDEGISGTSTYKRDSFLRMIVDATGTVLILLSRKKFRVSPEAHWTAFNTHRNFWMPMWVFCFRTIISTPWIQTASFGW